MDFISLASRHGTRINRTFIFLVMNWKVFNIIQRSHIIILNLYENDSASSSVFILYFLYTSFAFSATTPHPLSSPCINKTVPLHDC